MSFLLKNKLFKHLRKTYRKFKIIFDADSQARETSFAIYDVTFQTREISFVVSDADFQVTALIINNVKMITIIHFIVELRDIIVKSDYNFRN